MIFTKLQGGLGNQLFQYAAARYLSSKHNDSNLFFDTSYYTYVKNRHYILDELKTFGQTATILSHPAFSVTQIPVIGPKYYEWYRKLGGQIKIYREPTNYCFDPYLAHQVGDLYLEGFWQTAQYANKIRPILEKELVLNRPISKRAEHFLKLIQAKNSVAIHIRRGDYVHHPGFPICNLSYYQRALISTINQLKKPHFFVFSDDLEWSRANLPHSIYITLVSGLNNEVDEFYLMSQSKHAIIANSTFSWWAAWLHTNPDSLIIAPRPWLKQKGQAKELYLKNWLLLPRT